jgi:transposase
VGSGALTAASVRIVVQDEAAQVMLTRTLKWSWLKAWGMNVAKRRGKQRAIVALARRLAVIMHRMWRDGTNFRWTKGSAPTVA